MPSCWPASGSDGTFAPPILVENLDGLGSFGITVADFDRDGHPDMATTTPLGIYVYPGNGDGTFGPHASFPAPEGTHQLRTTDLNGDGFADLVGQGAHSHPASTSGGSIDDLDCVKTPVGPPWMTTSSGTRWPSRYPTG